MSITVFGTLVSPDGVPLSSVTIFITAAISTPGKQAVPSTANLSVQTNSSGEYSFTLENGVYSIVLVGGGVKTTSLGQAVVNSSSTDTDLITLIGTSGVPTTTIQAAILSAVESLGVNPSNTTGYTWAGPQNFTAPVTVPLATEPNQPAQLSQVQDSVAGVTSFNGRTGAVTLESSDVTDALNYIPANPSNTTGYTWGGPQTFNGNISVTGNVTAQTISGATGSFSGHITASGGTSGNQVVNYTQLTNGGFTPVFGLTTVANATSSGNALNLGQANSLYPQLSAANTYQGLQTFLGGITASGSVTIPAATQTNQAAQLGQVQSAVAGSVTSFDGRTGAVNLTDSDVTTALNYIPANPSNTSGYSWSGPQTFANGITVSGSVTVPTANLSGEAVNLGQMNSAIASVTASGTTFTQSIFKGYSEVQVSTNAASGTVTLNQANGNVQYLLLSGNTTIAFEASDIASGLANSMTIVVQQPASGGPFTVTWPTGTLFNGGTEPTQSTTASAIDVYTAVLLSGSTNWMVFQAGKGMAS